MGRAVSVAAAGAAVALVGAGFGAGTGVASPHARSAGSLTPTIKVVAGKHSFKVSGPTTFSAGRVALVLNSKKGDHAAEIASLDSGYTFKKVRKDFRIFNHLSKKGKGGSKKALKHLDRLVKNVNFYGGLEAKNQKERATVVLPTAGKYFVVDDTHAPKRAEKLTVTAATTPRPAPKSSVTETALTKRRFGGPTHLPAKGTITFKNKSNESPHFLALLHVKKSTTKKQAFNEFTGKSKTNYFLKDQAGTDVLGEGMSQTLHYNVPKGKYVEFCFFPDPKTGMPHVFMGMLRMVHLK